MGEIVIQPAQFASTPGEPFPGLYDAVIQDADGQRFANDLTMAQVIDIARRTGLNIRLVNPDA